MGTFLIEASPVAVCGLDLAIHRTPGKPGQWTISCPRCGLALGHGDTRENAVTSLAERIDRTGAEKTAALLAAQPDAEPAAVRYEQPVREKAAVDVRAIAAAIAERAGVPVALAEAVLATKGKNAGRLLARCPQGDFESALWLAVQPNPFKVGIGRVLFLRGAARELFDRVSRLRWPVWLDSDASALVNLGVW